MVSRVFDPYSCHSPIRVIRDLEVSGSECIEGEVMTLKMGNPARGLLTFLANASIVSLLDPSLPPPPPACRGSPFRWSLLPAR